MTIEQMIARQQELLNAARSAGRNMTREEAAEFDSLQRSIDAARAAGAGIAHLFLVLHPTHQMRAGSAGVRHE